MKIKKFLSISMVITILLSFSLNSNAAFDPIIDSIGSSSEDGKDGNSGTGLDTSQGGSTSTYEEFDASSGTVSVVEVSMSTAPKANFLIDRNAVESKDNNIEWKDWNANGIVEYGDLTDLNNDGQISLEDVQEITIGENENFYLDLTLLKTEIFGVPNILGEIKDLDGNKKIEMSEFPKSLMIILSESRAKQKKFEINTKVLGDLGQGFEDASDKYAPYKINISLTAKEWKSPNLSGVGPDVIISEDGHPFRLGATKKFYVTVPAEDVGSYSGKFEVKVELVENPYVGYTNP